MKKNYLLVILIIMTLNSCGVSLEKLVENNSQKDNNTGRYSVQNVYFAQDARRTRLYHTSKSEAEIREWFYENKPNYTFMGVSGLRPGTVDYFYFVKNEDKIDYYKKQDEKACRDAIVDAHRGMPSPNLSRKNIEKAISLCKECCKDELEASFYKDVPYLKREVFLEYFPDGKFASKVKQDIADLKSGKKKEVGMLEALGQVYDNSAVGQTVKEIGKALPSSSSQTNNTTSSPNYDVIQQVNVKRFEFTKEDGQINYSSFNLSVGCNDYTHKYDEETSKFTVQYISGDTNYTTHTDIASFKDEISTKYFSQSDGAYVTITFYDKDNELVVLKLKFKNGGNYRMEIYPN